MKKFRYILTREKAIKWLQKSFCLLCIGIGFSFIYRGWELSKAPKPLSVDVPQPQAALEKPKLIAKPKLSLEEFCQTHDAVICYEAPVEEFLREDVSEVAVVAPEEVNIELLQETLHREGEETSSDIASTKEVAEVKSIPVANEEPQTEIVQEIQVVEAEPKQEELDKLYEEPLPDNVIDEHPIAETEEDNQFTHIYAKNIREITIIPSRKPFYFGEFPVIAVVIDDMGISSLRTRDIASIKAPLTSSFLTYSNNLKQQINNAKKSGHEIMLHVPMEAQKRVDEAPDVLTTEMSEAELRVHLLEMLKKFEGIQGINNHMGSKFTEDEKRMSVVMEVLKTHQLFFLDSKTSPRSQAKNAALNGKVAYAQRNVFLDNNNDKKYILRQLAQTERLARKNGFAIAIGHPKSQTFAALKEWIPTLKGKKIVLKPLSEIVKIINPGVEISPL